MFKVCSDNFFAVRALKLSLYLMETQICKILLNLV